MSRQGFTKQRGFTIMELLVVIAIVGLLSSAVVASLNATRKKSRDVRRHADLKEIQVALELYQNVNGSFPSTSGGWWGNCSSYGSHPTTGATGYIPDLAPTHMSELPLDPRSISSSACYLYRSDGLDYKLLAHGTMETTGCPPMPTTEGMYDPPRSGSQCTIGLYTPGARTW